MSGLKCSLWTFCRAINREMPEVGSATRRLDVCEKCAQWDCSLRPGYAYGPLLARSVASHCIGMVAGRSLAASSEQVPPPAPLAGPVPEEDMLPADSTPSDPAAAAAIEAAVAVFDGGNEH